jgi:HEAT repeat protein
MTVTDFEKLSFEQVVDLLGDPDKWVQVEAIIETEHRKDPRAVPSLLKVLSTADKIVRPRIVEALGNLKGKDAVEPLCKLLSTETDDELLVEIPMALAKIGSKEAIPALREALKHKSTVVIGESAKALYFLKDKEIVPQLEAMLIALQQRAEVEGALLDPSAAEILRLLPMVIKQFKTLS